MKLFWFLAAFASLLSQFFPIPSHAATKTWVSALNGYWEDGTKWSGGTAPEPIDDVVAGGSNTIIVDSNSAVKSISIGGNANLLLSLPAGMSFIINPAVYNISGTITAGGVALQGVSVNLDGAGVSSKLFTDNSGVFSFNVIQDGSYVITPTKTGYAFAPEASTAVVSHSSVLGKNFIASATIPDTWTVSASDIFGPNILFPTAGQITRSDIGGISFLVEIGTPTAHNSIQLSAPQSNAGSGVTLPPGDYAITGNISVANVTTDQQIIGEVDEYPAYQPNVVWDDQIPLVPKNGSIIPFTVQFTILKAGQYALAIHFGNAKTGARFTVSNLVLRSRFGTLVQQQYPPDAPVSSEIVRRPNPGVWPAVIAWAQATTISKNPVLPAQVVIDWWALEKISANGVRTELFRDEYTQEGTHLSGLVGERSPLWDLPVDRTAQQLQGSIFDGGLLTIDFAQYNGKFVHWWSDRFATVQNSTDRYYINVRFKTIGDAVIQFGSDWWDSVDSSDFKGDCVGDPTQPIPGEVSTCEAWVSDWMSSKDFVEVMVPLN